MNDCPGVGVMSVGPTRTKDCPADTLGRLLAETIRALGADRGALMLSDPANPPFRIGAAIGPSQAHLDAVAGNWKKTPGSRVMCEQELLFIRGARSDSRCKPIKAEIEAEGFQSITLIPLKAGPQSLGNLVLYFDRERDLSEDERSALRTHAGLAAIENDRLVSAARRRATNMEILDELARASNSTLDLGELFRITVEQVKRAVPCERCSLYKVDSDKSGIKRLHAADDVPGRTERLIPASLKGTIFERLLETRAPAYLPDVRTDPHPTRQLMAAEGIRAVINVPIRIDDKCAGFLNVMSSEVDAYTDGHIGLLSSMAEHLAVAMKNAALYAESQQRATNLEVLDKIARGMNSTLNLGEVFRITVGQVKRAVPVERCSLYRLDPDKKFIAEFFVADDDQDRERWIKNHRNLEGSQSEQILETKKPFYEPDTRKSPHPRIQSLARAGLLTDFCAPILSEGGCVGFLNVGSKKPDVLTKEQMDFLVFVADHLALALRNAGLYARAKESGERLDNFVRGAADGIVTVDREGRITSWNPGAEAIYGYTEREAVGAHVSEIFDQDEEKMREIHERLKSGGTLPRKEQTYRRKDGSPVEVSVTYSALRDSTGRVVGISGIGRDITERKRAEEALKRTQLSVERAADATYWIAPDGRILYVNDATCDYLGYSREELLSKTISDLSANYPPEKWAAHWEGIKAAGSLTFESHDLTKDGRLVPVEVSANYLEFDGKEYIFPSSATSPSASGPRRPSS